MGDFLLSVSLAADLLIPAADLLIPKDVLDITGPDPVPIWLNEMGGLTVSFSPGKAGDSRSRFLKRNEFPNSEDLALEAEKLEWLRGRHPAPRVLDHVRGDGVEHLITEALPGTNADSYFAEGIPPTGHGTPVWKRGRRMLRLLKAMKGVDRDISRGELALLNDHAKADWRPVIEGTDVPVLFVAGSESEHWPSAHAAASAALAPIGTSTVIADDGHAANIEQPAAFNRILLDFELSL